MLTSSLISRSLSGPGDALHQTVCTRMGRSLLEKGSPRRLHESSGCSSWKALRVRGELDGPCAWAKDGVSACAVEVEQSRQRRKRRAIRLGPLVFLFATSV